MTGRSIHIANASQSYIPNAFGTNHIPPNSGQKSMPAQPHNDRRADDRKEQRRHNRTYPKGGVSCSKDNFVVSGSLVFQIKFCGKSPALRVTTNRWTHYRILSRVTNPEKRTFYLNATAENIWNSRQLKRQIKFLPFDRTVQPAHNDENISIHSILKDLCIFEFLRLSNDIKNSEFQIETAMIDHIQKFLLEFGKGFAFVPRQQHINTDISDSYVDLVFYNYILKCFVIIDLKTEKLSHQDIGQIDMYVRMYDYLKRNTGDNPTIGILLCTEKDEAIVKYSVFNDNDNLFASQYMLYMPKEKNLKQIIDQDRIRFKQDQK